METKETVKGKTKQYLTFTLDDEQYAVEVMKVQEVLEFEKVNKVPRTPDFMRGVINRRGQVLPVIDLRTKFSLPPTENTIDTRIIVMEIEFEGNMATLGVMADSVQEVIDLQEDHIEPPPKIGTGIDTDFIKGMGKYNEEFLILLDVEKIFTTEEVRSVSRDIPENTIQEEQGTEE